MDGWMDGLCRAASMMMNEHHPSIVPSLTLIGVRNQLVRPVHINGALGHVPADWIRLVEVCLATSARALCVFAIVAAAAVVANQRHAN